ncbi:MAG TPA: NAD(P)-dependent oxidoreductase [Tepidisphaeraceae bacterium]|nr:NAD(P)-dependent oxidoreductase [Tepidisphaeraceae bacterium]
MPQSFTATEQGMGNLPRRRRVVLVTGAGGNIGSYFAEHSNDRYDLRLVEKTIDDDTRQLERFGQVLQGDVTDLDQMKRLCQGVDTVLHLAANPSPNSDWASVRDLNITGTYNTFVAAKVAGCRRVIFASSIHAVSGYPADVQVKTNEPVNPGDLYGVSKCFGEALARYFAEKEGVSAICLRIGGFQPAENMRKEEGISMLDAWVSRRDLNQLIQRSIDVEDLQFAIFHGLSNNRFKRLDISDARQLLGYDPVDDLTQENPLLKDLKLAERVMSHNLTDGQKSGIRNEV